MQQATRMSKGKVVNGVDVAKLFDTIDAIKGDAEIARFKFRLTNKWINGGHNRAKIKDFYGAKQEWSHDSVFELDEDEHHVLLGEDLGPNPVEYLLTALSGCLTSAMVYHAAAKGITIRGVESRLEGDIDLRGFLGLSPDVKVGYENIRVYFKVDADVSEKEKEELIEMAKKYSPVYNTVFHATPVTVQLDK